MPDTSANDDVYFCKKHRHEITVSRGKDYAKEVPECPRCKAPMKEGSLNG
jgi:hypothetical protein